MGVCSPCCTTERDNDIADKHKCDMYDMLKINPFKKL